MLNLSQLEDDRTARTNPEVACQRAENLAALGVTSVLELCVGPSFYTLEQAYERQFICAQANDIDPRWRTYYNKKFMYPRDWKWTIGDALQVDWTPYDAVVFAPPVTRGCTGRRVDALQISDVFPRYSDFLKVPYHGVRVMVLPARAMATSSDRRELHWLLSIAHSNWCEVHVIPLTSGRRQIRKYVDVYCVG